VKPGEKSKAKTLLLQASTSTKEQKKQLILMKGRKISLVEKALGGCSNSNTTQEVQEKRSGVKRTEL
jgi:hypothetical protein